MNKQTTNVGYGFRPIEKWEEGCECFNNDLRDWFTCQWGLDCRQNKRLRIVPGDGYEIVGEDKWLASQVEYEATKDGLNWFRIYNVWRGQQVKQAITTRGIANILAIRRPITKEKEQPIMSELKWLPITPESKCEAPYMVGRYSNGEWLKSCFMLVPLYPEQDYKNGWTHYHPIALFSPPPPPVEAPEWEREYMKWKTDAELEEYTPLNTWKAALRAAARNPSILEPFKE